MPTKGDAPKVKTLAELPRTRASDVKKIGWRGVMLLVRDQGRTVVTNHDTPEAVIIAAEEYEALMQVVLQTESRTESVLDALRQDFDQRLAALHTPDAGKRLRSIMRGQAKLGGKIKAGTKY